MVRMTWHGESVWGIVVGEMVHALQGALWQDPRVGAALCPLAEAHLLAPLEPTNKVIGSGLTYKRMWAWYERTQGGPQHRDGPAIFEKQQTTHIAHLDPIVYPESAAEVIHEAELAVVIGRRAKNVTAAEAMAYVGGYTCANDVTARRMRTAEHPLVSTRFKNFDTFCPLGPWVETDLDPASRAIHCRVNGIEAGGGNTADLCYSVAEQVAWVSTVMTLFPGDIICTGSPSVGVLQVGDMVEVEVEGIGVLRNPVVAP
jgi:2-keto-4-pentenoate hydratase/2-oxohepta-3-ene-1,7-dioic acid hydratase in catechol pathway